MDTNNKEQINTINLEKVEKAVEHISDTPAPISVHKHEPIFSPLKETTKSPIFSKKILITLGILFALLAILTFVFKDKLFKNSLKNQNTVKEVTPEDYKKAIDQSFKDGYKTDYQYDQEKMDAAMKALQKKESKIISEPKVEESKTMLKNINN